MVERICSACQQANPLDDRFCGKCGAPLERQLLARRDESRLTIAGRDLPVTWRQVGRTAALGIAALAAEAGIAWLRRRIEAAPAPLSLTKATPSTRPASAEPSALVRARGSVVTIISQRVIEIFEHPEGRVHVSDRTFWRRTEE